MGASLQFIVFQGCPKGPQVEAMYIEGGKIFFLWEGGGQENNIHIDTVHQS